MAILSLKNQPVQKLIAASYIPVLTFAKKYCKGRFTDLRNFMLFNDNSKTKTF